MYAHIHLGRESSEIVMDRQWYGTPFLNIKRMVWKFHVSRPSFDK
jgi:hypothetical protein